MLVKELLNRVDIIKIIGNQDLFILKLFLILEKQLLIVCL